jgi:hypothetical protein
MKSSARQRLPAEPTRIHLRVKHPKLDPGEITRTLSIAPEHTLEAKRGAAASAAESYWIAPLSFSSFEGPWGDVGGDFGESSSEESGSRFNLTALQMMGDEAVVALAVRRLQSHQDFFQRVIEDGGMATLLLSVNKAGAMTIPPALARKLADLGLALELDWSNSFE